MKSYSVSVGLMLAVAASTPVWAQKKADLPKSVRLYVFDCGSIKGLDPAIFHFKKE